MFNSKPPLRVLVCDDERHIVRLVQVNLERQEHTVRAAFSGEEALAMMRAEKPDLLILDPDMPGMSGHDVMRAMQEDPELQSVKVILMDSKPFDPRKP